ncbi:MAG: DUF1194 domain-containing protein [Gammaproteobacteria bacterium]|nr:DUF1194 domain-containing protein [Gammaproteobacteria bacterium]
MRNYLITSLLGLTLLLGLSSALASPGTDWLETQLTSNGSFQNPNDIALPIQSTSETLRAFAFSTPPTTIDLTSSLQFVNDAAFDNTENLTRKIIANIDAGNDVSALITQLLTHQNRDGGFGELPGYDSTTLDTAFAAEAFALANQARSSAAGFAVGYLQTTQQSNGGWALGDNNSSIYVSALALNAISQYRNVFSLGNNIDQARTYLLGRRNINNLWGEVFESALSLIAIVPTLIDRSGLQDSLDALGQSRSANGSFANDVYQTALAERALSLAVLPSPDEIIISGRVVDGDTGLPLSSVVATLIGPQTISETTNNDGGFSFENLQPGTYNLVLQLENYSEISTSIPLQPGQQLDLGVLRMSLAAASPTTGVLIGTVVSSDSGAALANAQISITGPSNLTTTTGADGSYQIVNILPGSYAIQANVAGFVSASGASTINAGQTLVFSPQLIPLAEVAVTVSGSILSQGAGLPLVGVEIRVQGSGNNETALTDAAGSYVIDDLQPGDLTITASLTGFQTVSGSVSAPDAASINFSPNLVEEGQEVTPQPGGLMGTVFDPVADSALSGVSITLDTGAETQTLISGIDGDFSFGSIIAGPVTLSFTNPGFDPRSITIDVVDNTIIDLGQINLLPAGFIETAGIVGSVVDIRTGQALQGVMVDLLLVSGNRGFVTGVNGLFEFEGITDTTATINFTFTDYEPVSRQISLLPGAILDIGEIRLREIDVEVLLPDFAIQSLSNNNIVSDAQTFEVSGDIGVTIANRGNAISNIPLDVLAFYDADNDAFFDPVIDIALGQSQLLSDLVPDVTIDVSIEVSGSLPFRDAPISVWVDASQTLTELSEANNIESTSRFCATETTAPTVDLAFCLDGSGSVGSADFQLQLEGTALAIENPNIVPRDGSVRISVIQFAGGIRTELAPTIVESDTIQTITNAIRGVPQMRGGTPIARCIDSASSLILNALPASSQQVIDISTDGRPDNAAGALAAMQRAEQAGVDSINAIGVGGADLNFLSQLVFPQPAGGDQGFVIGVNTFEEYVAALSGKVQQEIQIADLTIGGFELIDNGIGQLATLQLVAGNAGAGSIPEGAVIEFYDGDPSDGGILIDSVILAALNGGEFDLIQVDNVELAQLARSALFAVADAANDIAECDETNNTVSIPVSSTLGQIALAADAAVYLPNIDATFTLGITNTGSVQGDFTANLIISDEQGNTVVEFLGLSVGPLESGASLNIEQVWNTGTTVAGNYVARAGLIDVNSGVELDEASVATAISETGTLPGGVVTLRTTTDRQIYHTTDTVEIQDLLQNISVSTSISDGTLQITVIDSQNTQIFDETLSVATLSPGGLLEFFNNLQLAGAIEGQYTVNAELRDVAGSLLATDQAQFEVAENLNLALTGAVEAELAILNVGDAQTCNYTASNIGTLAITDQPLFQVLVNIASGEEISATPLTQSLAVGSDVELVQNLATNTLIAGDYACVLQADIDGERQSVAQAVFTLEEVPIQLNASIEIGDQGRILVLIDPEQQTCTATQSVSFEAEFARPIKSRTKVYVQAFDQYRRKIDTEVSSPNKFNEIEDFDRNRTRRIDIAINALTTESISFSADAAAAPRGIFDQPYTFRVFYIENYRRQTLSSGKLDMRCGKPLDIPSDQNDLIATESETTELVEERRHSNPQELPTIADQRAYLESVLDRQGASYTIVDKRQAFVDAFRTGTYNQYVLLNERIKLRKQTEKELREAVYRGDGLIVAGGVKQRLSSSLRTILSLKQLRRYAHRSNNRFVVANGIELLESGFHGADQATFAEQRRALVVRPNTAQALGIYDIAEQRRRHYRPQPTNAPALTRNTFGQGSAVYAGFDLLREATNAQQQANTNLFEEILLQSLIEITPQTVNTRAGAAVPIQINIENQGIAIDNGQVQVTLPTGSQVVDIGNGQLTTEGQLSFAYSVQQDETTTISFFVIPAYTEGSASIVAQIQAAGLDIDTLQLTITETPISTISEIQAQLNTIKGNSRKLRKAAFWLNRAKQFIDIAKPKQGLAFLLKTTDDLAWSGNPSAPAIREEIDWVIWQTAQTLP